MHELNPGLSENIKECFLNKEYTTKPQDNNEKQKRLRAFFSYGVAALLDIYRTPYQIGAISALRVTVGLL